MRNEKRVIQTTFVVMLLLFIMLTLSGCSNNGGQSSTVKNPSPASVSSSPSETSSITVKSSDGSMSISAPEGWSSDNKLWDGCDIGLSGIDYYVVVLKKSKSNYAADLSANDFLTAAHSDFEKILYNISWKQGSDITIGNLSGVTVQMNAKNIGNRVAEVYLISVVADANNFYEIIGWASTDKMDLDLKNLQDVMNSLQVN